MRLDRLPRAITGRFDRGEPPRAVDPKSFKKACYLAAQMEDGTVARFSSDLFVRSYYSAWIETRAECAMVLCNSVYPFLAFLDQEPGMSHWRDFTFVPSLVLASHFEALTAFSVLDSDWLMGDVTANVLTALGEGELRQIKYYEPHSIGDIVFNQWD